MSFRKKKKQHDEEELEIMDLMEDMDLSEPDGLSEKPPKKKLPGWVIVRHFRTDRRRRQSICLTKSVRCGSQKRKHQRSV